MIYFKVKKKKGCVCYSLRDTWMILVGSQEDNNFDVVQQLDRSDHKKEKSDDDGSNWLIWHGPYLEKKIVRFKFVSYTFVDYEYLEVFYIGQWLNRPNIEHYLFYFYAPIEALRSTWSTSICRSN